MSGCDRTLVALAAAFVPDRARALLARLASPDAPDAVAHAARLAVKDRRERLRVLSAALAAPRSTAAAGLDPAALERPVVAALLRRLRIGAAPPGVAPVLLRLCRERDRR